MRIAAGFLRLYCASTPRRIKANIMIKQHLLAARAARIAIERRAMDNLPGRFLAQCSEEQLENVMSVLLDKQSFNTRRALMIAESELQSML
jgi:hypothetical protein